MKYLKLAAILFCFAASAANAGGGGHGMDPALPLDCMENVLLEKLYPVAQNPSPTGSLPQSERPSQQE